MAKRYEPEMTRFLRDMVAIPSESAQEEAVIRRIRQEMESVGFDRVEIDPMGNVLGYLGSGPRLQFCHPSWLQPFMQQRIGVETMDTPAALRTYNVLAMEGRKVLAALVLG